MNEEPPIATVPLYPFRGTFIRHHDDLQDIEIEAAIERTGWTGVGRYNEWSWNATSAYWDYERERWDANLLTACRISGHNMTPVFEDCPIMSCTNCGRCNEPECCPDLYPSGEVRGIDENLPLS